MARSISAAEMQRKTSTGMLRATHDVLWTTQPSLGWPPFRAAGKGTWPKACCSVAGWKRRLVLTVNEGRLGNL